MLRSRGAGCGVGAETIAFARLTRLAFTERVSLSATGYYATPKISWDRDTASGHPFLYFAGGAACSEVTVDVETGEMRVDRVDILHDAGRSMNPAIDMGQIEGGFVQGMGWLTCEELVFGEDGRLLTHAPSTYKIPTCADVPGRFPGGAVRAGAQPRTDHPPLQGSRRASPDARYLGVLRDCPPRLRASRPGACRPSMHRPRQRAIVRAADAIRAMLRLTVKYADPIGTTRYLCPFS